MHWFLDPIQKHYADFEGRVGRQEFWMYTVTYFVAYIGVSIVAKILHVELLSVVFSLALFIPGLAISARRLHDIGKSGWWQLLWIIPIVGWIVLIIWFATDTIHTENEYGAPARPKVATAVTPTATATAAPTEASVAEGSDSSDRS